MTLCVHKRLLVKRHRVVLEQLQSAMPRWFGRAVEQTYAGLKPDLVLTDDREKKAWVLDVKVPTDSTQVFARHHRNNCSKYEEARACFQSAGYKAEVSTFIVGAAGTMPAACNHLLRRIGLSPTRIRKTVRLAVRHALLVTVETLCDHLRGLNYDAAF